jgi:hypothetical protein
MTTPEQQRVANQPFQEGGEWRSYDSAGRLLRWDGQAWLPIPGAAPPPAFSAPAVPQPGYYQQSYTPASEFRFASLRQPATWVYILLAVTMVATVIYIAGAAMQYQAIGDLTSGSGAFFENVQNVDDADDVISAGVIFQALAQVGTAAVFIWWLRRAIVNTHALRNQDLPFTPGWAIGWWFIPFANLVQPLRVAFQAWRGSDAGAIQSGDPHAWKRAPVNPLLVVWWVVWLVSGLVGGSAYSTYDGTDDFNTARDASMAMLIGEIGVLVAAVLAIIVVRQMTQRHEVAGQLAAYRQ